MLADLCPPRTAVAWWRGIPPPVPLLLEEEPAARRFATVRRREFAAVRWCARAALHTLGEAAVPIVPGSKGRPGWPPGVVGSMTHCEGLLAAVVAHEATWRSLGIDAEPHRSLPVEIVDMVVSAAESARLRELSQYAACVHWPTVVFSAKEATFKAWNPVFDQWLDFDDVDVCLDVVTGCFSATVAPSHAVTTDPVAAQITGKWAIRDGFVVTTASLGADPSLLGWQLVDDSGATIARPIWP